MLAVRSCMHLIHMAHAACYACPLTCCSRSSQLKLSVDNWRLTGLTGFLICRSRFRGIHLQKAGKRRGCMGQLQAGTGGSTLERSPRMGRTTHSAGGMFWHASFAFPCCARALLYACESQQEGHINTGRVFGCRHKGASRRSGKTFLIHLVGRPAS